MFRKKNPGHRSLSPGFRIQVILDLEPASRVMDRVAFGRLVLFQKVFGCLVLSVFDGEF